jgi:hypothetical protein
MNIFGFHISISRPKNLTALHYQVSGFTEYAFTIDGQDFYHFKNYIDMPALRYQMMNAFISEAEMRMTRDECKEYLQFIKDAINGSKFTDAVTYLNQIEFRLDQFIETDTFYRLFSCAFFTKDEDITIYDFDYNDWKIELFKKQPATSFFFKSPIKDLLPQVDISDQDLEAFLIQTRAVKKVLQEIRSKSMSK